MGKEFENCYYDMIVLHMIQFMFSCLHCIFENPKLDKVVDIFMYVQCYFGES